MAEIHKASYDGPEIDEAEIEADGVRAGARALLFQALVNIVCSVGLPFIVEESGVQTGLGGERAYESLNGNGDNGSPPDGYDDRWKPMGMVQDVRPGRIVGKVKALVGGLIGRVRDGTAWELPIKGFTLVKLWYISQFTFAAAMAMTW